MQKSTTALAILEPLNFTVDFEWNSVTSHVDIKIEPMNITFSYQDFKLSSGIIGLWIPALKAPWPTKMTITPNLLTSHKKFDSESYEINIHA